MDSDTGLDALLRLRATPVEPEGLAQRVIIRAGMEPRSSKAVARQGWFVGLTQMLLLPRPAYAFATLLLCGVLLGFTLAAPSERPAAATDWQVTLTSSEAWL